MTAFVQEDDIRIRQLLREQIEAFRNKPFVYVTGQTLEGAKFCIRADGRALYEVADGQAIVGRWF